VRLAALLVGVQLLFLGPARADAVPHVSFTCSPAPQDCSGWYRSNVSIAWTVLPSGAAVCGCQNRTFSSDTAGTTVFCSANDGTASVTLEVRIRVD
jgi:hypothetical protein